MISAKWKTRLVLLMLASLLFTVTACKSAELSTAIKADLWLVRAVPKDLCDKYPELKKYGFYRTVTCTKEAKAKDLCDVVGKDTYYEKIRFCEPAIEKYLAMHRDEFAEYEKIIIKECK